MNHTLPRLLGAAVLAASLATAGTAGAAERPAPDRPGPEPSYRAVGTAPAAASLLPPGFGPPRRSIYTDVRTRDGRLYLHGDVEAYPRGKVIVQRKRCESCDWRTHQVVRTGRYGWFHSRIGAPKRGSAFWRAKVAPSGGWARSWSSVWETYY